MKKNACGSALSAPSLSPSFLLFVSMFLCSFVCVCSFVCLFWFLCLFLCFGFLVCFFVLVSLFVPLFVLVSLFVPLFVCLFVSSSYLLPIYSVYLPLFPPIFISFFKFVLSIISNSIFILLSLPVCGDPERLSWRSTDYQAIRGPSQWTWKGREWNLVSQIGR